MRPLSAVDAISPAWDHTRRLLLAKRDWRLLLKIGAIAVFAEIGSFNANFGGPMHHTHRPSPTVMAGLMAFALVAGFIAFLIAFAFFYLTSRLQFVLFDVVLRSDTTIAPIWRRFGSVTWRWIGLKLLFLLAALLCLAPFLIPVFLHFMHNVSSQASGEITNPAPFILSILSFVVAIVLLVLVFAVGFALLRDFGLPSMALEETTFEVTVHRILRLVRLEPGQVALYLLLAFLLRIAGAFVCYIVIFLGALIALIPLGGVGLVLWLALHHDGVGANVVMIAGWVILGLIFVVLLVMAFIMLFGYLFTFFQAYALFFLGGRYPMLGAYLESSMPPSGYAYTPPMYPPAANSPPATGSQS